MKRIKHLDIDENRSVWIATAKPYTPLASLSGAETADIAIIGGGFTGISTAYHLSRRFPQKRIVLLEALSIANGASGRNGGQMLNWLAGVESRDPEFTRLIYSTTKEGIDDIEQIIQRHRLDVRYSRKGCLEVFTSPERAEMAQARAEAMRSLGIELRFLSGQTLPGYLRAQGVYGAILDPSEGHLHGVDYLRELRAVLIEQGVTIYEGTPVLSVNEGSTITLTVPNGEVRANSIVLATNAYTSKLGYFRHGYFPLHSHAIATEPLSEERIKQLGWGPISGFHDDLDRISYAGISNGGEIIFGGGSNASYGYLFGGKTSYPGLPESAAKGFRAVEDRLHAYFPGGTGMNIAHRWTGTLCITMSRICSMGVIGEHKNVYYALGYSGHGVVLANLAGRVLCDIYSGSDEHWRKLPFYQKALRGSPPEPFRWIGYQLYTRLTGRSPRKSDFTT